VTGGWEFYEWAHRVDVRWSQSAGGAEVVYHFPEIGGVWLSAFGKIGAAAESARVAAVAAGLIR
jgi:hypothetical protein